MRKEKEEQDDDDDEKKKKKKENIQNAIGCSKVLRLALFSSAVQNSVRIENDCSPYATRPIDAHTHTRAHGKRTETRTQSEDMYYNKTHNFPTMAQVLRTSLKAFDTILRWLIYVKKTVQCIYLYFLSIPFRICEIVGSMVYLPIPKPN